MPRSPDRPPCGPCARLPSLTGLSSSGSRFLAASVRRGVCPDRPEARLPTSDPRYTFHAHLFLWGAPSTPVYVAVPPLFIQVPGETV